MALNGKVAIVSGGSGVVGSGIIGQYLAAGATVIAPLRGSSDSLLKEVEYASAKNLEVVAADVTNEREIAQLARTVEGKYGSVDHIVTVVGGWWQKGGLFLDNLDLRSYQLITITFSQSGSGLLDWTDFGVESFVHKRGESTALPCAVFDSSSCVQGHCCSSRTRSSCRNTKCESCRTLRLPSTCCRFSSRLQTPASRS